MSRLALACLLCLLAPVAAFADEVTPPKGFTALFNGKDLTGWRGMPHHDPYKLDDRYMLTCLRVIEGAVSRLVEDFPGVRSS